MQSGFFHVETVVRKIKYFPVFVKPSLKAGLCKNHVLVSCGNDDSLLEEDISWAK